MEDYRAGRPSRPLTPTPKKSAALTFPARRIAVVGASGLLGEAVIGALVRRGCRVAFTCDDGADGPRLAQRTGGRYYPATPDAMIENLAKEGDAATVVVYIAGRLQCALQPEVRIFSLDIPRPEGLTLLGEPQAVAQTLAALIAAPQLPPQIIIC